MKELKPHTLQDVIICTRDMEDAVSKHKNFSKPFIPQRIKDQKPFQREWKGNDKLDDETQ